MGGWVLFLEQLSQALLRAKPQIQVAPVSVESELLRVHRQPVVLDDDVRIEHLPLPKEDFWETAARAGKNAEAKTTGPVHLHNPRRFFQAQLQQNGCAESYRVGT